MVAAALGLPSPAPLPAPEASSSGCEAQPLEGIAVDESLSRCGPCLRAPYRARPRVTCWWWELPRPPMPCSRALVRDEQPADMHCDVPCKPRHAPGANTSRAGAQGGARAGARAALRLARSDALARVPGAPLAARLAQAGVVSSDRVSRLRARRSGEQPGSHRTCMAPVQPRRPAPRAGASRSRRAPRTTWTRCCSHSWTSCSSAS